MDQPAASLSSIIEAGLTKYSAELHQPGKSRKGLETAKAALVASVKKYVAEALEQATGLEHTTGHVRADGMKRVKTMTEVKKAHVQYALSVTDTLDQTARVLGVDIATLYRMRKRWGMPMHEQHDGRWHYGKPGSERATSSDSE